MKAIIKFTEHEWDHHQGVLPYIKATVPCNPCEDPEGCAMALTDLAEALPFTPSLIFQYIFHRGAPTGMDWKGFVDKCIYSDLEVIQQEIELLFKTPEYREYQQDPRNPRNINKEN